MSTTTVEVVLRRDPMYGSMHEPKDVVATVDRILRDRVPHYVESVLLADSDPRQTDADLYERDGHVSLVLRRWIGSRLVALVSMSTYGYGPTADIWLSGAIAGHEQAWSFHENLDGSFRLVHLSVLAIPVLSTVPAEKAADLVWGLIEHYL